jgi:predicted AlkP superfamily pyrophosphatase or phosphodiesterase
MNRTHFLGAALVALLSACSMPPPRTSPAPDTAAAIPAKLLLISIDGLRADALDRGITPNLSRLAREGVRARWMNPSYPSLTFPNHYTIVTGLRPDHHGIVHNTMDDIVLGHFEISDRNATSDPRWWGGEPIWVGAEKAGIPSATWSWPGSEAPIQGRQPSQWQPYDGNVPAQARVERVLQWLAQQGPQAPRLLTLYFDKVDHAGHEFGPNSPAYAAAITETDTAIGTLLTTLEQRGTLDSTNIIVVSDHGMADVPNSNTLLTTDIVPASEATVVASRQTLGIQPLPGQQAKAEARLLGRHEHYDCWRKQELPPRWHYGSNPRISPIVCQMHEGWNAQKRIALKSADNPHSTGSHGFDPALPSMRAVFVARGPAFAYGKTLPPFDNVDVYPLLTRLLGIPAASNDGNPDTLLPALRD